MPISRIIWFVSVLILFSVASFTTNAELVGYWSFDKENGVTDLTGNSHDGIIHGNPEFVEGKICLLYTSPSPRDRTRSRMPSSA